MFKVKRKFLIKIIFLSAVLTITLFSTAISLAPGDKDTFSLTPKLNKNLGSFQSLGITGLKCNNCSFSILADAGDSFWTFNSEPKILHVNPRGPAKGKLKKGDEIVALDGMLITTRRGGKRLAEIKPREVVEVTVRRNGRIVTESITAEKPNSDSKLEIKGFDTSPTSEFGKLSHAVESLAEYATNLSKSLGSSDAPEPPDVSDLPGLAEIPSIAGIAAITERFRDGFNPEGWFGFRLSFSGSVKRTDDGPTRWRFNKPPKVESVEEDSPADRAGLKKGDVLTHIDGTKLTSKKGGQYFSAVVPGQTVLWTLKRGREKIEMDIDAIERPAKAPAPPTNLSVVYEDADGHTLRYTGSLGETNIEVTGDKSVKVTVDKKRGFIMIKSDGATVRLQLSGGAE